MIWGTGMYLWSFVLYWIQVVQVMRTMPPVHDAKSSPDNSPR